MPDHVRVRSSTLAGAGVLFAVALATVIGCGTDTRPPAFELATEDWVFHGVRGTRLITTHFDVRTTVEDAQVVRVLPVFLESCRRQCERMVPPRTRSEERLATYIFNTRWQWERFTDEFVPERAALYRNIQSGGYTDQPTAASVLYWIGRDRTLAVAGHEAWHQYVARHLPAPIPAWLNEGLATQLESFTLQDGVPVFDPRNNLFRRNYLRTALIVKEKGLFELSELLRIHAGDVFASPAKSSDTYYAQLWSLTLFLLDGPNKGYRDGFRALLADAGTEALRTAVNAYVVATPAAAGLSPGELVFRRYVTDRLDTFKADYVEFARDLVRGTPKPGTFPW